MVTNPESQQPINKFALTDNQSVVVDHVDVPEPGTPVMSTVPATNNGADTIVVNDIADQAAASVTHNIDTGKKVIYHDWQQLFGSFYN